MPARRRKRRIKVAKRINKRFIKYLVFTSLFLFTVLFTVRSARYWNDNAKLTILVQEKGGDVSLITLDPVADEITSINIPSNTEVEVARQLGVFRVGNVWKLGFSEGFQGDLLTSTVTKNFKFPVFIWAENEAAGFASSNYLDIARATVFKYKTNLGIGDKLRIAAFTIGIPNSRRTEIILSDTPYLQKTTLVDGEDGYLIVKNIPLRILSIFADPVITKGEYKAAIINNLPNVESSIKVGEIIEVLGAKVASVQRGESDVDGCIVRGRNEVLVLRLSEIFHCAVDKKNQDVGFDTEIILGSNFEEIF